MTSTMISTLGRGWQPTGLYNTWRTQSGLTRSKCRNWVVFWRDMAKHQAPGAPSLQRAFWLSLWAFTRTLWSSVMRSRKRCAKQDEISHESSDPLLLRKEWAKSDHPQVVGQWLIGFSFTSALGPRTCGGFHLSSGATLSMTKQCWVIHWHQIPRLRGSAGTSAQRTSNRAIKATRAATIIFRQGRKKDPLNLEDISEVSHNSPPPKKKKSSTLSFPNKGLQSAGSLLPTLQDLSFTQTLARHIFLRPNYQPPVPPGCAMGIPTAQVAFHGPHDQLHIIQVVTHQGLDQ